MVTVIHRSLLVVFGRLPRRVRRVIVRTVTPSFTVGAICVIQREDGRIVLIKQRYRSRWGLPGGLAGRGEHPEQAVVREVREEIGLDIELLGEPAVVVEPGVRRVDVVFEARPRLSGEAVSDLDVLTPVSPEIVSVDWFPLGALPELQEETTAALEVLARRRAATIGERDSQRR